MSSKSTMIQMMRSKIRNKAEEKRRHVSSDFFCRCNHPGFNQDSELRNLQVQQEALQIAEDIALSLIEHLI